MKDIQKSYREREIAKGKAGLRTWRTLWTYEKKLEEGKGGGRIGEVVVGRDKRKSRKGSGVEEMGREKKGVL